MAKTGPVVAEYNLRKDAERNKALMKYGPEAIAPAGRPEFDVLDFTINELVGMVRYAEMNEARARMMLDLMDGQKRSVREALRQLIDLSREVQAMAGRYSFDHISIRQRLKAAGLMLGTTEATWAASEKRSK